MDGELGEDGLNYTPKKRRLYISKMDRDYKNGGKNIRKSFNRKLLPQCMKALNVGEKGIQSVFRSLLTN